MNLNLDNKFIKAHDEYLNNSEFHAEVSQAELTTTAVLQNQNYELNDRDRAFIRMGAIFALYSRDHDNDGE